MKVRVCYTVDADDDLRRAIAYHYDLCEGPATRKATRDEVRRFYEAYGNQLDDDVMYDLDVHEEVERLKREDPESYAGWSAEGRAEANLAGYE